MFILNYCMSHDARRTFPLQNEAVVNGSTGIRQKLINGMCVCPIIVRGCKKSEIFKCHPPFFPHHVCQGPNNKIKDLLWSVEYMRYLVNVFYDLINSLSDSYVVFLRIKKLGSIFFTLLFNASENVMKIFQRPSYIFGDIVNW